MEQKNIELYPRIVYNDGIELRLSRREQLEFSKPYINTSDMNMDGKDEVVKLSKGQALLMLEKLARHVRYYVKEKTEENDD
tara:strand:- start:1900 stop:2142 length:243 start_codon:yes stop_codon:yes gene_type:complete